MTVDRERITRVRDRLVPWYRRHQRDLPWRRTRDPYAVWVAEIMLQQTRAATVGPYYERFLKRFPDTTALAEAPLDDVLKAWEGLGYYGRARNLQAAARRIVAEFGGRIPATHSELLSLPGVGRYTAGAVASIAFGLDEPVLDGNVTRVLCRVFCIRANPKKAATQKKLWRLARDVIPPGKAGEMNQALMDLGATVCTPRDPACPKCPLKRVCLARQRGLQERVPAKVRRKPIPHHDVPVAVIRRGRKLLIAQRRPEGFLGGLWEFPGGKRLPGESLENCLVREVREELGVRVRVVRPLATARHAYSHFRVTLFAYECRIASGRPRATECARWKWVDLDELDEYAFPKGSHKIIAALRASSGEP